MQVPSCPDLAGFFFPVQNKIIYFYIYIRLMQQLNPTWDWQLTSRNGTGTTRPLSVTETEETKQIWTLKDAKKPFKIKWKVLKRCRPYNNVSKKCNLCLHEKFVIICRKDLCTLNKRNELASSCPHRNRYVLKNFRIT